MYVLHIPLRLSPLTAIPGEESLGLIGKMTWLTVSYAPVLVFLCLLAPFLFSLHEAFVVDVPPLTKRQKLCSTSTSSSSSSSTTLPPSLGSSIPSFAATILDSPSQPQKSSTLSPPPPPPWSFQVNHLHYQFRWMRAERAKRHCPPEVHLLSLGGYTLGGIFCVDYADSPIGPYQEVAILSGLVVAKQSQSWWKFSLGAWASHIFVDSEAAAACGRQYWGLPTHVVNLKFGNTIKRESEDDSAYTSGAKDVVFFSSIFDANKSVDTAEIVVSRWNAGLPPSIEFSKYSKNSTFRWLDVTLPSLSGRLPLHRQQHQEPLSTPSPSGNDNRQARITPLLEYPLRITQPQSIRLLLLPNRRDVMTLRFAASDDHNNNGSDNDSAVAGTGFREVEEVLQGSKPIASLIIDHVALEAGVAKEIS